MQALCSPSRHGLPAFSRLPARHSAGKTAQALRGPACSPARWGETRSTRAAGDGLPTLQNVKRLSRPPAERLATMRASGSEFPRLAVVIRCLCRSLPEGEITGHAAALRQTVTPTPPEKENSSAEIFALAFPGIFFCLFLKRQDQPSAKSCTYIRGK